VEHGPQQFIFLYDTCRITHMYSQVRKKSFSDRGKKSLRKKEKIHCHLRYEYFVTVNQKVITTVEFL